jgi:hypothetical protein
MEGRGARPSRADILLGSFNNRYYPNDRHLVIWLSYRLFDFNEGMTEGGKWNEVGIHSHRSYRSIVVYWRR